MRKGKALSLAILLGIFFSMAVPMVVQAVTVEVESTSTWRKTYSNLNEGDVISWTWSVVGDGDLDFWIVDSHGTNFEYASRVDFDAGSFIVPEDGRYHVTWYNPDPFDAVTLDYDVSVVTGSAGELFEGLVLTLAIVGVIIIVIVIAIVIVVLKMGKKPREPERPQPPPRT